ncbi:MAG: ABC transporter ATP-binding protein [Trueperaceae bacterium]
MLEISNLTKRYGRHTAIDDLTLAARPGEVLALLGPNGAGKTTTIRCAVGLATPNSGYITVAGHDTRRNPLAAKRAIGFVPDRAWFYPKVSARELLRYIAGVRRVSEADAEISQLLERFRIDRYADNLTESYSHGMRQRLAFCAALVGKPGLLITDEPMVGLDVHGHREVKRLFRELAGGGRTVVLTTHTLSVAEEVADRIALVNNGRLIALGTMDELRLQTRRDDANLEDLFIHLTGPDDAATSGEPP